jgi:hypothetical protein
MPRPRAEVAAPAATPHSARQCPSSAHPPRSGVRLDLSLPLHAACGGVGALDVVVGDVLDQVALERGHLGDQGAGEAGSPALLEDGRLDSLDAAVGLRPAGPDEALLGAGGFHGLAELLVAELRAVVGGDRLQLPSGGGQLRGHPADQS